MERACIRAEFLLDHERFFTNRRTVERNQWDGHLKLSLIHLKNTRSPPLQSAVTFLLAENCGGGWCSQYWLPISFEESVFFPTEYNISIFLAHGPVHDIWITGLSHALIEANNIGNDRAVEGIGTSKPNSKMVRTPAGIQETQKLNNVSKWTTR